MKYTILVELLYCGVKTKIESGAEKWKKGTESLVLTARTYTANSALRRIKIA
jgi:hypothetical protein